MSKDTFENFKRNWESQIAKIEKEAIDDYGTSLIRLQFERDKIFYKIGITEIELRQVGSELNLLDSNLETALQIARSRFKLQHRGILAKAFGGILDKFARK